MTDFISQALNDLFLTSLGMTFPDGLLFITILMGIIFSIQDYRIGFIALFLLSIADYIYFNLAGFSLTNVTLLVFSSLLLLAFSLYATQNASTGGSLA